jgi:hypothetical protein
VLIGVTVWNLVDPCYGLSIVSTVFAVFSFAGAMGVESQADELWEKYSKYTIVDSVEVDEKSPEILIEAKVVGDPEP